MLAHELRNPLMPLRNGVHLARRLGTGDAGMRSLIGMMERQLGTLTRLVNDLLDVSRIDTGKLQIEAERVTLQELLRACLETNGASLQARGHGIELELPAQPLHVLGDTERLMQVFNNLLSNAAKYSEPSTPIRLSLEAGPEEAVVCVRDHGMGIPPQDLQHIFNMYSQVRLHHARAEGGLGIGLALVKRIVELHGGTVRADSEGPGHGSAFTVRLPLAPT